VYRNGSNPFTMTASATIVGGQVLESTGSGTAGPAGAASLKTVGVAAHDCSSGARITIWPLPGVVHETTTPTGVTAGAVLITAAAGTVDPVAAQTGTALMGVAITTAAGAAKVRWIGR
jgi:ammonia channel protein AmtB